ncbi:hypothetical protein Zm00014a_036917 [Zea mays]|uniref:Uncharacterized protein n=1 Tax=Zea mays TaxID=4577 RepID=A0A3L6DK80_MAIZE|nr:hypothetical protein Zm00014a_036917 [Zea mays]
MMRSKSSPPAQSSMTRCTELLSSYAPLSSTTPGWPDRWYMICTSRRTSSTSSLVDSFRLLMVLHANLCPVALCVHSDVTPNCPRPSSLPTA